MSLLVWIPLIRDNSNQGLLNLTPTNQGTVSFIDGGKLGKCLSAGNGTQIVNGISYNSNLIEELGNEYSAAVWVKPLGNHVHYNGTIVSSGDWNNKCWSFGLSQNNSQVDVFCSNYNTYITCAVPTNTWTHLACSCKNGIVKLYKNGEYVGERAVGATLRSDATNFTVGRETYANGYFSFNGNINDLRIYNHALSAKEVKELSKGLVCHYPLNDTAIESTVNLSNKLSDSCYNASTQKYGYGSNTDTYKISGVFHNRQCEKVYMGTSGLTCFPYVFFNYLHPTAQGEYKTLSFDYYPTIKNKICFYTYAGAGEMSYRVNYGQRQTGGIIPVNLNQWNHIEFTVKATSSSTSGFGYMQIGAEGHTSNTSNYWLFANIQVEAKDHATAWTSDSRDETIVYDTSGFNYHGTRNTSMVIDYDSAKYNYSTNFNGTDNSILIPFNSMLGLTTASKAEYTVSVWTYKTSIGTKGYQTILGGVSGFELEARVSSGTDPKYKLYSWGGSEAAYEFNKWNHFCFVHTASDCKLYVNGVYEAGGSAANVPIGNFFIGAWNSTTQQNYEGKMSDFRIYATTLSAEQVAELYQSAAHIDNHGNVYGYEFKEVE